MISRRRLVALAALGVLAIGAALLPLNLGGYYLSIVNSMLILAVFALAFNLAYGFAGVPSFGHAAFYGLGAYGFIIGLEYYPESAFIPVLIGIAAAFVYSLVVGYASSRGRGIQFALITFAFAQFLYETVVRLPEYTGGEGGKFLMLFDFFGFPVNLTTAYYFTMGFLALLVLFSYHLRKTPYGNALRALKYNEDRAKMLGYPTRRIKVSVFVLSGVIASFAGILYALSNLIVTPEILFYSNSIDPFLVVIIGGANSVIGPVVGAIFFVGMHEVLRPYANVGTLATGVVFILIILFASEGLVHFAREVFDAARERLEKLRQ